MSRVESSPFLASIPVYIPGKPIDDVAREIGIDPSDIIKLASNENPLGPSPRAVEAMRAVLPQLHLYPDGNAFHLKRKLAGFLSVPTQQLTLGNGSNEILELLGHAYLRPGDEVIVSEFCFAVYPIITALFGANLVTIPARDFAADVPAMVAAVTPRTRMVFLANPNNPTGTLTSRDHIAQLLAEVPPHVLIVMDEAYVEFLEDPVDCLALIRENAQPNLVITRTFSKIFGLAGLRLGYALADDDVIANLEKVRQPFNLNSLAQAGALAALDDAEHLARTRASNRLGLEYFHTALSQSGIPFVRSHANFVLAKVGDGLAVFRQLQQRGIITRPTASYQLKEWLRISVGTSEENTRCLTALREICSRDSVT